MGLEKVADAIFRIIQGEVQTGRGQGDRIREEIIEGVEADGRYRIGRDILSAKGRARLRAGQRVHVLWQQGRRVLILTHQWQRAQPGASRAPAGGAVIEELILGTLDGTTELSPAYGNQQPSAIAGNHDLWFRNGTQLTALGLTAALTTAGLDWSLGAPLVQIHWGYRDDTFVVVVGDGLGRWTGIIGKLNRDANRVYGAAERATATILRTVTFPTIALTGTAFPSGAPPIQVVLTEDLRLLTTTTNIGAVSPGTTLSLLDLDAGTILWQTTLTDDFVGGPVALMRWGATNADRWVVYSRIDGTTGHTATLHVRTLEDVDLFTDSVTVAADHTPAIYAGRCSETWLLYVKTDKDPPVGTDAAMLEAYWRVAPGAGGATLIGSVLGVYQNPSIDITYSKVTGSMLSLIPLRGQLFYVMDENIGTAELLPGVDVERELGAVFAEQVGWLGFTGPLAPTALGEVGVIWPAHAEREKLVRAADLTDDTATMTGVGKPEAGQLFDYPAGYFSPWPYDTNSIRGEQVAFTALHLVNDPSALGDLAAAAR